MRHYYLRADPQMGDLSINLTPKGERSRASHAIALDIRARLAGLPLPPHASLKVVEVPPGPPVLSTLLAEVYGPDAPTRRALATKLRKAFESVDFVVDVDDSFGAPTERLRFAIDQEALEFHGVEEQAVYDTIGAIVGGTQVGYSQRGAASSRSPSTSRCRRARSRLTSACSRRRCPPAARRARARMSNSATS